MPTSGWGSVYPGVENIPNLGAFWGAHDIQSQQIQNPCEGCGSGGSWEH